MDVDVQRKRIALSMRLDDDAKEQSEGGSLKQGSGNGGGQRRGGGGQRSMQQKPAPASTMDSLFDQALSKKKKRL
jgi:uncharacterized protein